MKTFTKDPDSRLNYTFKWANWLDGDTISTSSWSADSGITVYSDSNDTNSTTVFMEGGTAGETYTVTNSITTAGGLVVDRSMQLQIQEK